MRQFFKVIVAFFLTLMWVSTMSAQKDCLLFSINSKNNARLGVVNAGVRVMSVQITNTDGEIFFTKTIDGGTNYFQLLDLSQMPDGTYKIKATASEFESTRNFIILNRVAKVQKQKVEREPVFTQISSDILSISYSNVMQNDVTVSFDLDGESVFKDSSVGKTAFTKRYTIVNLPKGKYNIIVKSGNKTYTYPLEIK